MIADPKLLLTSMLRCNAAYIVDPTQAAQEFQRLGCVYLGQYRDDSHQAVAHIAPDKVPTLTISGTRASEGPLPDRIGDLLRDIDWTPIDIGNFRLVAKGAYDGMDKVYAWAAAKFTEAGLADARRIEGHSLGGWRAAYAPLFWDHTDISEVTRFEPPKAGNFAFWADPGVVQGLSNMTTVIHGEDPWVAWPWSAGHHLVQPPGNDLSWLHSNKIEMTSEVDWDGPDPLDLKFEDHGPTTVIADLMKLAV
jgi:hypothetical protein